MVLIDSMARPSLDMPVCDFGRGAYFGSRGTPSLDMQVCDFCVVVLTLGRWQRQVWICRFVMFVVVLRVEGNAMRGN